MERISTDTDSDSKSSIGVGQVNQVIRSLAEAQPNWLADGLGIRGPQRSQEQTSARSATMDFGIPSGTRHGADPVTGDQCNPPNDTDVFVRGAIAGVCQWIPICEAPCP